MIEQDDLSQFLTPDMFAAPAAPDEVRTDPAGERILWQGLLGVAEFALEDGESAPPRWSLPETTEVTVTDRRVAYAHVVHAAAASSPDGVPGHDEVTAGEIRWLWPQHVRVQPGARAGNSPNEIHLVCGSTAGGAPALVLFGGDLTSVGEADRLGNLLRKAITQFRLNNAGRLDISTPEARMLSRLLIIPEFSNYPGGPGQTVALPGALPLAQPGDDQPDDAPRFEAEPRAEAQTEPQAEVVVEPAAGASGSERPSRPVIVPQFEVVPAVERPPLDPTIRLELPPPTAQPMPVAMPEPIAMPVAVPEPVAEQIRHAHREPRPERAERTVELALRPRRAAYAVDTDDLAARASDIAARVAELVNRNAGLTDDPPFVPAEPVTDGPPEAQTPEWPVRPSAARFATNSGRIRGGIRRAAPSTGTDPATKGRHR